MIINHNLSASFANRVNGLKASELNSSIQKLSSGLRINNAGDDASGLAVSEKMRAQIQGMNRASTNVQDAVSFMQAAEGYLTEVNDVLLRVRELSIQAANGIYSDSDRTLINTELNQLVAEVDRVAKQSQFNGRQLFTGLLDAETGTAVRFHVGPNVDQYVETNISALTAKSLGLVEDEEQLPSLQIQNSEDANFVIARVDTALDKITKQRADLGALQSRLGYLKEGLDIGAENLQAAESRIRDTDIAKELTEFVRSQILTQSSLSMLAQANAAPQNILALL